MPHVLELFRLDGKAAIVTGGSKGLGRAIALCLSQAGADVVVASRTASEIQEAAREIERETQRRIVPVVADVRKDEEVQRILCAAVDELGRVDIVVNSAGVNNRKPAVELSVEEFEELVDINLTGTFRMCRAVGPLLMAQRSGRVINLSSMLDHVTIPGRAGYAASKGGVLQLTKTLALEWAPYGIRVNALSPGPFATPINKVIMENEELNRQFIERIPVRRWGRPEEVGAAAVYLASPASDFVTGTTLYIDGGWTAQ
jgi:NAD(P)-dependent dehydrogenase (short-subunit alcohol dehydrogenase family)